MADPRDAPAGPLLAAAVVLVRDDDAILLVRQLARGDGRGGVGPLDDRWTLPLTGVSDQETAEAAVERICRDQLHIAPGAIEFNDTIYLVGREGTRFVVNAFLCVHWEGEPRTSAHEYGDAAWVMPTHALALAGELAEGLEAWLVGAFGREAAEETPEALAAELDDAYEQLLSGLETIPVRLHHERLADDWTPLDVITHVADAEAHYAAETRRLLDTPGHTWRPFNDAQWDVARALRARTHEPEDPTAVRARLDLMRADTRRWLASLTPAELSAYGNHAERGAVQVAGRITKIANHAREHAEQLRAMARATRLIDTATDQPSAEEA
ncbi:MAG: DinB family protein [Chloroflexi bacterium]|nr:DinB family protein [Chloroflexota bacterium]MDA1004272.1 DinB family protein [Chloroflexota bacterium]